MLKEFVAFLKEYGIIGLAMAVIIGGKLNDFVGSLVNDLVMPLILKPALEAAQVADIRELSAGIDFLVVALLVFVFAKIVLREEQVAKK
jgi:large conductance mechanosensitive channel